MIPNENRRVRVGNGSLHVPDGMVVAVIDYDAAPDHHILPKMDLLCGNQRAVAVQCEKLTVQHSAVQNLDRSAIGDFAAALTAPYGMFPESDPCFCPGALQPVTPNLHIIAAQIDFCAGSQVQDGSLIGENTAVIRPNNLFAEVVQV